MAPEEFEDDEVDDEHETDGEDGAHGRMVPRDKYDECERHADAAQQWLRAGHEDGDGPRRGGIGAGCARGPQHAVPPPRRFVAADEGPTTQAANAITSARAMTVNPAVRRKLVSWSQTEPAAPGVDFLVVTASR